MLKWANFSVSNIWYGCPQNTLVFIGLLCMSNWKYVQVTLRNPLNLFNVRYVSYVSLFGISTATILSSATPLRRHWLPFSWNVSSEVDASFAVIPSSPVMFFTSPSSTGSHFTLHDHHLLKVLKSVHVTLCEHYRDNHKTTNVLKGRCWLHKNPTHAFSIKTKKLVHILLDYLFVGNMC